MKTIIMGIGLLLAVPTDASAPDGERLAYVVGCINCHHQTPKEIINAPPLLIVNSYSLEDFSRLMRTGRTSSGRDLPGIGSLMGIVAVEQFSHMTDAEVRAIYEFLRDDWTQEKALLEEAKIPDLYKEVMPPDDPVK